MPADEKGSQGKPNATKNDPKESPISGGGSENNILSSMFPVVGIGASAGGLEAIQTFFAAMPNDHPDMAFVVVSHLDPSHNSILGELIQKHTRLKVQQIATDMELAPNHVYVIPPNRDLQIADAKFVLTQIGHASEQRAPINLFFRSLAKARGELAAGIVLSGMGSDGATGLQAIKGELGVVLVQKPEEAKYDGMPRSAIQTGNIDFILSARDMPQHLIEYFQRLSCKEIAPTDIIDAMELKKIHAVIRSKSGHDFSHYKESTVKRRITRRLNLHGHGNALEYVRFLQRNPEEVKALVKELLIGVTQFFRDPKAFQALKDTALPQLTEHLAEGRTIRAWVAGCATGEEAYSLAILLREFIDEAELDLDYQIFATDLDEEAIEIARSGIYSMDIARDIDSERLKSCFRKENNHYHIRTQIREKIIFATQSLIKDPPFTHLDLLLCRNLLIYLDAEIQKNLIPLFHYCLNPGGILFLGNSETAGHFENQFSILDSHWKIYQRKADFDSISRHFDFQLSTPKFDEKTPPRVKPVSITELAERTLLDQLTPPAIIIDQQGEIRYIHGRVYKFLEHVRGAVRSYNAFEMAREGLKLHLITTLRQMRSDSDQNRKIIRIGQDGDPIEARVTISPLKDEGRGLFAVMLEEICREEIYPPPPFQAAHEANASIEVRELYNKLMVCEEKLRTTVEELESTNEELRSSNEEYQSTNEELQSANEELNSSKEELQSLNEELETVNTELQGKVRQIEMAYDEMSNMLDSLNMPAIFLDANLCIRRFSSNANIIVELIESDIGRPIKHLHSKIPKIDLQKEAREVLAANKPRIEKEVKTNEGMWYLMRIMPYPDQGPKSTGVVMSFVDISKLKDISNRMHEIEEAKRHTQSVVDTVREPLIVLDRDLQVISASRMFYDKFLVTKEDTEGRSIFDLGNGQWDIPELHRLLEEVLPRQKVFNDFPVEHDFPKIGLKKMLLNARAVREAGVAQNRILLAIEDVTEKE